MLAQHGLELSRRHPALQRRNVTVVDAPIERIVACRIGGMSGSASFTAIWVKPQEKHSISIRAMAPGLSGRPADDTMFLADMFPQMAGLAAGFLIR